MATLTWQDVAGQVRAPDYSEASELMTRGLGQISAAVQAPERLRQEKLDREMKGLLIQSEMNNQTSNMIDKIDTKLKNEVKERDLKEFSKNQSYLESASRKAAIAGVPLPDFLANDPVYKSMGEGAKSYSASHLSDAYLRGDETRITMEERAKNDAYRAQRDAVQDRQWAANYRLSAENARLARAETARSRKIADEAAQMRLDELKRAEADRKFLDTPLGILTARAGTNYNDAIGKKYENMDWGDIAKASGIKGYSEYLENLRALNAKRLEQNKRPLPEGAAKSLLAAQIGKNGWITGVVNEVDGFDVDNQLLLIADQYDASLRETDVLNRFKAMQDKGIPFKDSDVLAELARANPPVTKRKPVDPPITMFNWKGAGK